MRTEFQADFTQNSLDPRLSEALAEWTKMLGVGNPFEDWDQWNWTKPLCILAAEASQAMSKSPKVNGWGRVDLADTLSVFLDIGRMRSKQIFTLLIHYTDLATGDSIEINMDEDGKHGVNILITKG